MMHTPPKYLASFDLGAHSPSELPSQPGQIWHPLSCDSHSFTGVGGGTVWRKGRPEEDHRTGARRPPGFLVC